MSAQLTRDNTENGTSGRVGQDIPREVNPVIIAAGYQSISERDRGTSVGLPWAFGLNGSTLAFVPTDFIAGLREPIGQVTIREKNQKAIALLDAWFCEPDDLGTDFWDEFDKNLEGNKFII